MTTSFKELKRQVFLKMPGHVDGIAQLAVEQAINDAQTVIAYTKDFDELIFLDTANAKTTANTNLYHMTSNLNLTRPKDIYSIRLMANDNSRKLTYVPLRKLDEIVPYTNQTGTGYPDWYTIRGEYVELYKIPNANYSLYIQHSRWPAILSNETDTTPFVNIDPVIVTLAVEMALSSLEGSSGDWFSRARQLLGLSVKEETARPDQVFVAQPFNPAPSGIVGEYWNNPWIRKQPGRSSQEGD